MTDVIEDGPAIPLRGVSFRPARVHRRDERERRGEPPTNFSGVAVDTIPIEKTPSDVFESLREDLHRLARFLMSRENPGHTLQATALVSEVWIGLFAGRDAIGLEDRDAILGRACVAMKNLLIDHARRRGTLKRGGGKRRVPLDGVLDRCDAGNFDVVELRDALEELAKVLPRAEAVFTLRFIAGFKTREVADQLGVSGATVENDYALARGWLRRKLGDAPR